MFNYVFCVFCFKQKTAYEMRISDWSSDVCSSDRDHATVRAPFDGVVAEVDSLQPGMLIISAMSAFTTTSAVGLVGTRDVWIEAHLKETDLTYVRKDQQIGRASCRERVCQYV